MGASLGGKGEAERVSGAFCRKKEKVDKNLGRKKVSRGKKKEIT